MMKKYFPLLIYLLLLSSTLTINSQNYYFVSLNTNPDKEQLSEEKVQELQNKHLENIGKLHKEGIIVAAGPFEGGGGLFIMKEESIENVNNHLSTDPAISANRFNIEVLPLKIQNGKLCNVPEDYEMVTYHFVRLIDASNNKSETEDAFIKNRVYMNELGDKLVIHGKFNNKNDGFIILNTKDIETARGLIANHPSVKNGHINYEIKQLWIAKETFCSTD